MQTTSLNRPDLIARYNIAAPRYTSYPTVPYWEDTGISPSEWIEHLRRGIQADNGREGISLYIHLPYCESLCTYCGCNTRITVNHGVERPYIEALLAEWKLYREAIGTQLTIREIHLGGGTPTFFSESHLEMLIHGVLSGNTIHPQYAFSVEGHPNLTTRQQLEQLRNLGFTRVSFGIQDFDPYVQDLINRVQPIENVERVTRWARELGFDSINFDLVYGLPGQRPESVANTIHKVLRLRPDRIANYSYAHVPWIKPGQRKFTEADLPEDTAKRKLFEIGYDMLTDGGYMLIGMDHFALPQDELAIAQANGSLHRNFMGYAVTEPALLIGLGVSSIGDSGSSFAQNDKVVESYRSTVLSGSLPIVKGHVHTAEDLILRDHILNLMCRYETNWEAAEEVLCPWFTEAMRLLLPMESDGLVQLGIRQVKVTTLGRDFLRNICMAFDARYWRKAPTRQIFSTTA